MDIDFHCTSCGRCCKDLRLPLSASEAVRWLEDGHAVDLLCEAIPWPGEPPATDPHAAYRRERSFASVSGTLPIRVQVTLAAPLGSRCPNLLANDRCGIYERRPEVCRIYPAEPHPFRTLTVAGRRCPPDAWQPGGQALLRNGEYVDATLHRLIRQRRERSVSDVPIHRVLCAALGIRAAAMANEGYVVHSPDPAALLRALRTAHASGSESRESAASPADWTFVSDRPETVDAILSCGARCARAEEFLPGSFEYLSLSGRINRSNGLASFAQ